MVLILILFNKQLFELQPSIGYTWYLITTVDKNLLQKNSNIP